MPIAILGAGEYVGEVSLLRGIRHTASVRAIDTTHLLVTSGAAFNAMATSSNGFAESFADVMQQRPGGNRRPQPEAGH